MLRYVIIGTVVVSIVSSVGLGVYKYITLQIAYEAAQKQLTLNKDLEAENLAYAAQVEKLTQDYVDLQKSIKEGNNETISEMDGPLGNVLRLVSVLGLKCQAVNPTGNEHSSAGAAKGSIADVPVQP